MSTPILRADDLPRYADLSLIDQVRVERYAAQVMAGQSLPVAVDAEGRVVEDRLLAIAYVEAGILPPLVLAEASPAVEVADEVLGRWVLPAGLAVVLAVCLTWEFIGVGAR